ncbi:uncharacterized protein LOC110268326 [Arachis ipaensis]|uniref:uncharacterized protein LOC110268326 n=1 Tax=Arachis ipaensis TaxID=130454 RepID=UPI000A2B8BEA|nr:uncharacterized protein LOC110268326 [Arachis ipaensis]XP_025684549.1 uncharacterized protein LOC112785305 [Arachis hypogaea]
MAELPSCSAYSSISAKQVKLTSEREDSMIWKFDKYGSFSTNSFVQVMQAEVLSEDITRYSFTSAIWRGFVPPKIELFSWFVLVERVNTNDRLCRLGVIEQNDNMCVLCCKSVESAFHLFIGCEFTWQVWSAWLFALGRLWTMPGSLKEHFQSWTTGSVRKDKKKRWFIDFFTVI